MQAGVDTIKVVTRHNVNWERRGAASRKRPKRMVCTRCGDRMAPGAEFNWVVYRTWIVFSETGETGLDSEEHRCPRCERETAGNVVDGMSH